MKEQNKGTKGTDISKGRTKSIQFEAAIARFLERCGDIEYTNERLFDILHYAMESESIDEISSFDRGSLMFVYREISKLINSIYKKAPLEATITRFLDRCETQQLTEETFYDMLHYAIESKTADHLDRLDRGALMFIYREISLLIKVVFTKKESEVSYA